MRAVRWQDPQYIRVQVVPDPRIEADGDILALLNKDEDVLGVQTFATRHLSLDEAPHAYETLQKKQDGAVKIVFRP
jgi:threonine dehydrogenase-like Zn-dependent dehydrogenase